MEYSQFQLNPLLEHKFDKLIKGNNNKESLFSPLNYNPKYLEDNMAWEKLKGNQTPYDPKETVNKYVNHSYIFNPKLSKTSESSELENLKNSNLNLLSSPLIQSKFHLHLNNPNLNNQYNQTNINKSQVDNQTTVLNLRGNTNGSTTPIYFNFNQNPTLQPYNFRPNDYNPKNHSNDRYEPIINEIKSKIQQKNEFMDELFRRESPRPKQNNYSNYNNESNNNQGQSYNQGYNHNNNGNQGYNPNNNNQNYGTPIQTGQGKSSYSKSNLGNQGNNRSSNGNHNYIFKPINKSEERLDEFGINQNRIDYLYYL